MLTMEQAVAAVVVLYVLAICGVTLFTVLNNREIDQ